MPGAGEHHVRGATAQDAAACAELYAPYVTETAVTFEVEPPTPEEMARRIAAAHRWLVLEDAGRVVGYAYAGPFKERAAYRWACEVSVYLERGRRRTGGGRALCTALLDQLRDAGFTSAVAGMALPNPASVALHEALGFVPVGTYRRIGWKHGAWHDVLWMQRALAPERDGPDAAPVAVAVEDPDRPDVRELLGQHLAFAHAVTPREGVHALDLAGLRVPEVTFLTARAEGALLGVAALKRVGDGEAEVKSMHTARAARGRGVARVLLADVVERARRAGVRRLLLETGSQAAFAPARALYASAGFEPCGPFAGYPDTPTSAFMVLELQPERRPGGSATV